MTTISQRVAQQLEMDLSNPIRQMSIGSIHQTVQVPVVRLDALRVGDKQVTNFEVAVISFGSDIRIDGLLGVNFLQDFRVRFEFRDATLVLR